MKKSNIKICVVGLGYIGGPLSYQLAEKYKVVGFDKNQNRVDKLIKIIATQMGEDTHLIDSIIEQVDRRLEINRGS